MAEQIRSIEVTIEIDTNKRTVHQCVARCEDESFEDFAKRVLAELRELTEVTSDG